MRRLWNLCLVIALSTLLPLVAKAAGDNNGYNKETFRAENFSAIHISGPINVQMINQGGKPWLQLVGDSDSLCHVYAAVVNGTLYLSMDKDFVPSSNSHITAIVNNTLIDQIYYSGSGQVTGTNFKGTTVITAVGSGTITILGNHLDVRTVHVGGSSNVHILGIDSRRLDVLDNSSGKVNLGGTMVLQSVTYNGTGTLSIYWIDSTDVTVRGNGNGRIFLAGVANLLDVILGNHTWLDARYLRANRAFVDTRDMSQADVWARCSLGTLPTGNSNVYYYNNAGAVGNYMTPFGSSLNMTGIDPNNLPMPAPPC